jgi:predicted AlkP superfamily phosphohydrolase/phosphomutase
MTVDMGIDRIQHAFWKFMDPRHPKHPPGNPYEQAIHDYYVHVDARLAELLELVPDETLVLVVSDHGAQAMLGGICVNEWLLQEATGARRLSRPAILDRSLRRDLAGDAGLG